MKYIIANWKANKTVNQSIEWATSFRSLVESNPSIMSALQQDLMKIVICPPYPFLFYIKQILSNMKNVQFGVQNISQFTEGSHTGEITASMLKQSIDYSIIGHSERRSELHESESEISQKMEQLNVNSIQPILCIRNDNDTIYKTASLVTFEPVDAIGTGNNMNVTQVLELKQKFKINPEQHFIYGGSVTPENCREYLENDQIDGVLIGKASLDPKIFLRLAEGALK